MIRVVLALLGLVLVFIWLGAPISRKVKMVITVLSLVAAIGLVLLEAHTNKPREGMVGVDQIVICNQEVKHSYRSDFKVSLCLQNQSSAVIKRIHYSVTAQNCDASDVCQSIQVTSRDRMVSISPQSSKDIQDTLRFENVDPQDVNIDWSATILSIKAVPNWGEE